MRKRNKHNQLPLAVSPISLIKWLCLLAICVALLPQGHGAIASESPAKAEAAQAEPFDREAILREIFGKKETFVYERENRSDPFTPFIREQVIEQESVTADAEEVVEEVLTGLRRFEPGQLTLVAVILKDNGPVAMVQDPVGKGYIVEEGTLIGRSGTVEKIINNTIVIQQTTRTWNQEKFFKRVEMVLRKEGER